MARFIKRQEKDRDEKVTGFSPLETKQGHRKGCKSLTTPVRRTFSKQVVQQTSLRAPKGRSNPVFEIASSLGSARDEIPNPEQGTSVVLLPRNDNCQTACKEAGFTLLEMAMALLILVIVIASSLLTVYKCLSILQTSRDINIALSDIREAAEILRQEVDDTGTIKSDSYALPHIDNEQVVINADASYNPIQVNVRVGWQGESQRQRSVTMDMLFKKRRRQ